MDRIFVAMVLISPFLLLATYIMTARMKSFWRIFIFHTIVFVLYMALVINYSKWFTGHDEYGLGQIGLGITFIIIHIIVGFLQGLYLTYRNKKDTLRRQISNDR